MEPADFIVVGILIILEGLLSADNALVLALLVRHLPHAERGKALLYGLVGAFVFRSLGIFFAAKLIHLWWVCAGGALYLIYLAVAHFIAHARHGSDAEREEHERIKPKAGFWKTIFLVEVTDIVFAIDSILVAVALVSEEEKLWIVYVGGILGLILLRMAASGFTRLIERFPRLDAVAYALVGWAGIKLASAAVDIYQKARELHEPHLLPKWAFWVGFILIVSIGVPYALRHRAPAPVPPAPEEGETPEPPLPVPPENVTQGSFKERT